MANDSNNVFSVGKMLLGTVGSIDFIFSVFFFSVCLFFWNSFTFQLKTMTILHLLHLVSGFFAFSCLFSFSIWDYSAAVLLYFIALLLDIISIVLIDTSAVMLITYLRFILVSVSGIGLLVALFNLFSTKEQFSSKIKYIWDKTTIQTRAILKLAWSIHLMLLFVFFFGVIFLYPLSFYFRLTAIAEFTQIYVWFLMKIIISNERSTTTLYYFTVSFTIIIAILSLASFGFRIFFFLTKTDYSVFPVFFGQFIEWTQIFQITVGLILIVLLFVEILAVSFLIIFLDA